MNERRKIRFLQNQFIEHRKQVEEAISKENDRMAKYAKLEGYSKD